MAHNLEDDRPRIVPYFGTIAHFSSASSLGNFRTLLFWLADLVVDARASLTEASMFSVVGAEAASLLAVVCSVLVWLPAWSRQDTSFKMAVDKQEYPLSLMSRCRTGSGVG